MDLASLVTIIVYLVVFGVVLYLIERLIPMDDSIKVVIRVVVVLALCLWLFSLVSGMPIRRIG